MKEFIKTPFFDEKETKENNYDNVLPTEDIFFNFIIAAGKLSRIVSSSFKELKDGTKLQNLVFILKTKHSSSVKGDISIRVSAWGNMAETIENSFEQDKNIILNGYLKLVGQQDHSIEIVLKQIIRL